MLFCPPDGNKPYSETAMQSQDKMLTSYFIMYLKNDKYKLR